MDVEQRRKKAESLRGREVRSIAAEGLELRDVGDGTLSFTGYASVTERGYDMGWYEEVIGRGAFAQTLTRNPDVQMLINHEGLPIARTVGGTLSLTEDDTGLRAEATLDATDPDVQRLAPKVERGLIDQMSFAFSGARSEWDEEMTQRRITSLDIHRGDVSVVNQGANPATSFTMRSLIERLIEPSDEALAELRELFGPDDLQAALATLTRLAPAPEEEPAPDGLSLDFYRARAFQLRARGVTV